MGHLAIVQPSTIGKITDSNPYISYVGVLGDTGYKTIADLFADALSVREGDLIFTWCVNEPGQKGWGFDRYYVASGSIGFDPADPYPIKIAVKEGYKFVKPVSEEAALDLFSCHLLWNAIGKKSLGRGRSLSHQTIDEDKQLMRLLKDANRGAIPTPILDHPVLKTSLLPISISNFATAMTNPSIAGKALNTVPVPSIIWNKGSKFLYEKALEAYLCEHIDKISEDFDFCSLIGYPGYQVKWIGNYLPYGVAGDNIDLVIEIENQDSLDRVVVVIELKDDSLGYSRYCDIADYQLTPYADYIFKAFSSYRGSANVKIEKVVLTGSPLRQLNPSKTIHNNTKWVGYEIDSVARKVFFKRVL